MAKVGEKRFIVAHAYYHFVGEIAEVLGKNHFVLKGAVRVHYDQRGFGEFFAKGFLEGTTQYAVWGDDTEVSGVIASRPWPHAIPRK